MSLYVGRLPPHIRPGELLRVFQKFGRCELQLKDGYGFVVYKVITDAERALRALRGKNICGEQLSLNWSNRQPRPHKRSPKPCKIYEPYRGRNFKGGNGVDIRVLQDQRELSRSDSHVPSYNNGRHQDYAHDKETVHTCEDDDIGRERNLILREEVTDEGNAAEHNPVENDRWGVPVPDELTGHGVENGTEFDLYEPYHGYNRRDEKENSQMASSYSSPGHRSSPVKRWREPSYDETTQTNNNRVKLKPQPACYNCGQVGHIKRNCPEDVKRDVYSKFGHGREEIKFRDRAAGRREMLRSNAWERRDANRGALIFRHQGHDEKECHSGRSRRLVRRRESSPEMREKRRLKLRAESQAKKRSKQEPGTWRNIVKKRRERRSDASSLSSDSSRSSSQLHSQSSNSELHTTSRSTSRSSSRSHPAPFHSRSVSVSSSSKSKSSRLRSRSSSGSKSATLSVSSGKRFSSSPQNAHLNVSLSTLKKGKLEHPISHFSKNVLCENSELNEVCGQHLRHNADDAPYSASIVGYKENSSTTNLPKAVGTTEQSNLQGALTSKPKLQSSIGCGVRNPQKITTQEMILALKHYGLPAPEEGESEISVEEYFGAARLWPWEMIYYQRLKKGPISTENYARRLEQNKEFGIVDKYVRSSSGWAECEQNDK